MIYETVSADHPVSQGDIFAHVPRVDFSLSTIPVVEDEGTHEESWVNVPVNSEIAAVLSIKSVTAIVVTQNCDAQRGEYLCLAQIDPFLTALNQKAPPKSPDKWQSLIVGQSKGNSRLFFLPADNAVGFAEPMIADFRVIVRVPRLDLEALRTRRIGKLNRVASEHFREMLSHFFRRYAYNEWYPLTREQFDAYSSHCDEPVLPYPWQRPETK